MKKQTEYNNKDLSNHDFRAFNLEGCTFLRCNLSGAIFTEANLNNSIFELCYSTKDAPPNFESVKFEKTKFSQCKFIKPNFNNAQFIDSIILSSNFEQGYFIGCRFNGSLIEDLNISKSELHMCSFINAQILSITYKPYLRIPFLRGHSFFRKSTQIPRTIFINYNEHLDFTEFCHSEARKDKFFAIVNRKNRFVKNIALFVVAIFGLLTNFGTSFTRWVVCAFSIILIFSLTLCLYVNEQSPSWYLISSTKAFFDIGSTSGLPDLMVIESVCGYFMLGILISLLSTKINLE